MAKKSVKKTAKKKVVKKVSSKKPMKKRSVVKAHPKSMSHISHSKQMPAKVRVTRTKFMLVTKNLILFIVLSLISYLLYTVSNSISYRTFFYALTIILGFLSLAFLVSLVILLFIKLLRK